MYEIITFLLAIQICLAVIYIRRSELSYLRHAEIRDQLRNSLMEARQKTSLIRDLAIAYLGLNDRDLQNSIYQLERNLSMWSQCLEKHESGRCSLDTLSRKVSQIENSIEANINRSVGKLKKMAMTSRPVSAGMSELQRESFSKLEIIKH